MHHARQGSIGRYSNVDILELTTFPSRALTPLATPAGGIGASSDNSAIRMLGAPPIESWRTVASSLTALGDRVVCAFVGVLGMRAINLGYSRSTGDRVLWAVMDRLGAVVAGRGQVARVAGDRFMVAVAARDWSPTLLDSIVESFAAPIEADLGQVRIRSSIGVWSGSSSDGIHLLDCADEALRSALRQGAGSVVIADTRSTLANRSEALIVSRFGDARSEITPHFQPIVDLLTGEIVGLEALARWTSRDLGDIPPASWVPLAEDSGLIHEFGMIMLTEALDFVAAAVERGEWGDRYMSVNISPVQLESPTFVGEVLAALTDRNLPTSMLLLELTEADTMTGFERITDRLKLLHWHGVRLALDDFGTGIANFEYLRGIPLDLLKIDRRFVAGMLSNPLDRAIVRAVLTVASELGLGVLAEGVETSQQHAALLRLGCTKAQGFLYSAARPPADALQPVTVPRAHFGGRFPIPVDDAKRLQVLRSTNILDTPPDADFDRLVARAAELCGTPAAVISLIDEQRQWFKARVGVELTETDRSEAFCSHTICQSGLLEVPDATADDRFARFDVVRAADGVRFYAGAPIGTDDGYALGTICVFDMQPRELTIEQREGLLQLAQQATMLLSARRHRAESRASTVGLHRLEHTHQRLLERLSLIVSGIDEGVAVVGEDGRVRAASEKVSAMVGRPADAWVGHFVWRYLDRGAEQNGDLIEHWFRAAAADPAVAAPLVHVAGETGPLSLSLHRSTGGTDELVLLVRREVAPLLHGAARDAEHAPTSTLW